MDRMLNAMKRHVEAMVNAKAQPCFGIVVSVDPTRPAVRVRIQPDDVLTGWLPIAQSAAAGGWGVYAVPTPGMVALCIPDQGEAAHWVVNGFVHSDAAQPPKVASAIGTGGTLSTGATVGLPGEVMMTHASGSVIRMCADGSIYMRGPVNIDGTLRVNGNVFDQHGSLDRLSGNYNVHTHTQGADAHGDAEVPTNAPLPQDPE